jgi:hypothetical protein
MPHVAIAPAAKALSDQFHISWEVMMAKRVAKAKRRSRGKVEKVSTVFGSSAELVRAAASVLDQEMAVGIEAAKAVQQRVSRERKVETSDFKEAMARFQTDARDVVSSLEAQLGGSRLPQNVELAKRFLTRANDMVDLAVGMVTTSAEIASELLQKNAPGTDAGLARKRPRRR